jgi:hypothetical protein
VISLALLTALYAVWVYYCVRAVDAEFKKKE